MVFACELCSFLPLTLEAGKRVSFHSCLPAMIGWFATLHCCYHFCIWPSVTSLLLPPFQPPTPFIRSEIFFTLSSPLSVSMDRSHCCHAKIPCEPCQDPRNLTPPPSLLMHCFVLRAWVVNKRPLHQRMMQDILGVKSSK